MNKQEENVMASTNDSTGAPRERVALDWLLTRIGSWTSARWDQHLRGHFGDSCTDEIIKTLGYERCPAGEAPRLRATPTSPTEPDWERWCTACAEAAGIMYEPDTGPTAPGPVEAVVRAIEEGRTAQRDLIEMQLARESAERPDAPPHAAGCASYDFDPDVQLGPDKPCDCKGECAAHRGPVRRVRVTLPGIGGGTRILPLCEAAVATAVAREHTVDEYPAPDAPPAAWTDEHHEAQAWLSANVSRAFAMSAAVDSLVKLLRLRGASRPPTGAKFYCAGCLGELTREEMTSSANEANWLADQLESVTTERDALREKWQSSPGALTAEQLAVACKNIGFDVTCGACAMLFYTGYTGPTSRHDMMPPAHDPGCASSLEPSPEVLDTIRAWAKRYERERPAKQNEKGRDVVLFDACIRLGLHVPSVAPSSPGVFVLVGTTPDVPTITKENARELCGPLLGDALAEELRPGGIFDPSPPLVVPVAGFDICNVPASAVVAPGSLEAGLAGVDPGVRSLVAWLNLRGFKTTDSGDGVSKADVIAEGEALHVAHVHMRVGAIDLLNESQRLMTLLDEIGVTVDPGTIQATYDPADGIAVLTLSGVDDGSAKFNTKAKEITS